MANDDDEELESRKRRLVELMRNARPAPPAISVSGNHNVINVNNRSGVVHAYAAKQRPSARGQPKWRVALLASIRADAERARLTGEQVVMEASRVLGRALISLKGLNARDLGRVHTAIVRRYCG